MIFQRKLMDLFLLQKKINEISGDPNTTPSENILQRRSNLESDIFEELKSGKVITRDPFFDYCIYHFHGDGNYKSRSVFNVMPRVKKFVDYVSKNRGELILSTYDYAPDKYGAISMDAKFGVDTVNNWRSLYVPVEKLFEFNKEKFKDVKNTGFYVHPDIFNFANYADNYWSTYPTGKCIGESGSKKREIYIGTAAVNSEIERNRVSSVVKDKNFWGRLGRFFK